MKLATSNFVDQIATCNIHFHVKSGLVTLRQNEIKRNVSADLMNKVCKDVQKEPSLLPMAGKGIDKSDNKSSKAWLDISAKDLWIPYQRVFFAIRAFDTNV